MRIPHFCLTLVKLQISHFYVICALRYFSPVLSNSPSSLRDRRLKGMEKRVLGARETRGGARGVKERKPVPLLPRAWSRALIPFTFPFERLPRRLQSQKSLRKFAPPSYLPGSNVVTLEL